MNIVNFKLIRAETTNNKGKSQSFKSAKMKIRTESLNKVDLKDKRSFILIKKIKFLQPNKSVKLVPIKSYPFKISNEISFSLASTKHQIIINGTKHSVSKSSSTLNPRNTAIRRSMNDNKCLINYSKKDIRKLNSSMSPFKPLKEENKKLQSPHNKEVEKFIYIILPGNNSELIRKCLNRRSNWKEASSKFTSVFNLKWGQSHYSMDYSLLSDKIPLIKIVNHFEFELEISNKKQMFSNIIEYCDRNHIDPFKYLPLTILIKIDNTNIDQQNLENFKYLFENVEKFVNLPGCKYPDLFQISESSYNPQSTYININPNHYSNKNLWIIKPPDQFGGKNIVVLGNLEEINKQIIKYQLNLIEENKENNNPEPSTIIIQKYVERPLLYKGRKFDIRIWVLINYDLNVYMFKEGHLKLACLDYNIETNDRYVHITNYSVQKYNRNFEKYENGNELSFKDFQNYLDEKYGSSINIYNDIYPKFTEIIKISTSSIGSKINKKNRKYSFVVLGYDFLIDEDFNVWLLEINKNPGLAESSPIIKMLLPRMIDNCLSLTVDEIFKTSINKERPNFHVDNYNDEENLWYIEFLRKVTHLQH